MSKRVVCASSSTPTNVTNSSFNNVTFRVTVPTDGRVAELKASGAAKIIAEPVLTADDRARRLGRCEARGDGRLRRNVRNRYFGNFQSREIGGRIGTCAAEASGAAKLKLVARTAVCAISIAPRAPSKIEAIGAAERCELLRRAACREDRRLRIRRRRRPPSEAPRDRARCRPTARDASRPTLQEGRQGGLPEPRENLHM